MSLELLIAEWWPVILSFACVSLLAAVLQRLLKSARVFAPMTASEAKALWQIHKQREGCTSKKWRQLTRKHAVVGFECGCGLRRIQKRPLHA